MSEAIQAEHVSDVTLVCGKGAQPAEHVVALSVAPSFEAVEQLLADSKAPPPVRPNRNRPIHDDPADWELLNQEALSANEFDEIAAYLKATGQESA